MTKWADYCVFAVKYDAEHSRITDLVVAEDLGDLLGTYTTMKREQVVDLILNHHKTFVTVHQNGKAKYNLGQPIHVVPVGGENFLRTDRNETVGDNLENLPEL